MTEPAKKTYYQVSFTGAQALVGLVGLLAALALAFFLGAKAGFEKSVPSSSAPSVVPPGESDASATSPPAPTSTTIEVPPSSKPVPAPAAAPSSSPASPSASLSTPPVSTQEAPVFEDREAGVPEQAPSRTEIAGEARRAPAATPAAEGPPKKSASGKEQKPAAPAAKPVPGFYVQVLSTTSKAEATRWKEKLAAKKYRPAMSAVDSSKGKMYRLRLGPFPDKEQARKLADKISAEFGKKAWVAPAS